MKIKISCAYCDQTIQRGIGSCVFVPLNAGGAYEITCPYGHVYKSFLLNQHYDILFESGVTAFNCGFYKEAIFSFASSLERFYQFYIDFVCVKNEIFSDAANKTWKLVSSQSERQLGAFIFLYLLENNKEPNLMHSKTKRRSEDRRF